MKLSEVFTQLSHGELSQVSIGGGNVGEIDADNYPKMVSHVNMGLTALYKRFPLKEDRLVLPLVAGTYQYSLVGDLLKVEQVLTDLGEELSLNDGADPYSVHTPSAKVLRVPKAIADSYVGLPDELKTNSLEVVYRANHPMIPSGDMMYNPHAVELELPYSHLEPLLLYVASRVHNPIGMTNEFHAGNSWYAKYEAACVELEMKNLNVDQGSQNTRSSNNGWV